MLDRYEQIYQCQKSQLEGMPPGESHMFTIQQAHDQLVLSQKPIFKVKKQASEEQIEQGLMKMKDTFNLAYDIPSQFQGLQWTGLELASSTLVEPGSVTRPKNVTIASTEFTSESRGDSLLVTDVQCQRHHTR